jgi:polysaccharide pyruvyl transferase CsaB
MKLLIAGYYGFGNIGDEAILASTLSILHQINEEIEVTVIGGDSEFLEKQYDVQAISWDDDRSTIDAIRTNDSVILGGGGLINDYWGFEPSNLISPSKGGLASYLSIPFFAYLAGKPCMLLSAGVGPFSRAGKDPSIAQSLNLFEILSVRDRYSSHQLTRILDAANITRQVEILIDPAFKIEPIETTKCQEIFRHLSIHNEIVGVNLRFWGNRLMQDELEETIAGALDQYLEENRESVCLFIPFQSVACERLTDDLAVLSNVRDLMLHSERVLLLDQQVTPEEACNLISRCGLFIGMRYHANLFALKSGVPSLGLVYDPKIRELYQFFNQGQFAITEDKWNRKQIYELVNKLPDKNRISGHSSSVNQFIKTGLKRTEDLLTEFLAYQSINEADASGIVERLFNNLNERLSERQKEVQAKDEQILEIVESNRELRGIQAQLEDQLSEYAAQIDGLHSSIVRSKKIIEKLEASLLDVRERNQINIESQKKLINTVSRLENWYEQEKQIRLSIQSTIGFKVLSAFWRLGKALLPEGTLRRKYYYRLRAWFGRTILGKSLNKASGFPLKGSKDQAVSPASMNSIIEHLFFSARENSETRPIIIQSTTQLSPFNAQRSAQFAHELSLRGNPVLYSYWRWVKAAGPEIIEVDQNLMEIPVDLFLGSQDEILNNLREREGLILIEYPNPAFFETLAIASGKGWLIIYDIVDDWEEFNHVGQAPWYDPEFERYLVNTADLVVAVNGKLAQKAREFGASDVQIIPNGYSPGVEVSDIAVELKRGKVTLGYFGHLTSAWFDWDLVMTVAEDRKDWMIHLIGELNPNEYPEVPDNVIFHSKVKQKDLAAYAQNWDVAIVPFKDNPLSRAADPIKSYEYSAMRLPVVMTGCFPPDGAEEWMIRIDNPKLFVNAVEKYKDLDFDNLKIDEFLAGSRWSSRVDQALSSISFGNQRLNWKRALFTAEL